MDAPQPSDPDRPVRPKRSRSSSPAGRAVETRALTPHEDVPNATVGAPATVGSPNPHAGDPDGVIVADAVAPPRPPSWLHASRWAGWPAEWYTPQWGNLEQLTDVAWAALDLNASVFAAMPPYIVGGAPSLAADWISNPSPDHYESWSDFAKQLIWDFQMGEAIVVCTSRYSTGWPARFHLLPPWTVSIEFDGNGQRTYRVGSLEIPRNDILHLRYKSTVDDARGHGALEAGRSRMVAAGVLLRYATDFAVAGGVPSSVLEHPEELTAKQSAELQEQWIIARMAGLGLPAVLSGGVTWKATQINPLDSALTELAQYNEGRIAVLLGVPPFLLGLPSGGDSLTYSTTESLFDFHWRAGLKPKAQRLMTGFSNWALPRGTGCEVNRDEYIRPGPLERAQTQQIYHALGVLSTEEIREIERFSVGVSTPLSSGVMK